MFERGYYSATALAPATVSNVAVGFDILGFSLTGLSDRVTVTRSSRKGVHLVDIEGSELPLPQNPAKNTATAGLVALVEDKQLSFGLDVCIEKGIPQRSGLGGSAASAVAAVVAASAVLDEGLTLPERFEYALQGEEVAAGAFHGDNVAPALLGGLILVRSMDPLDVVRIPVPHDMGAVIVRPHIEVDVREARQVLRKDISFSQFVGQTANLAGFLAGCFGDDRALIARSLKDLIVEEQRAHLIPGFKVVQEAALAAGAMGCSISGAGPTVFALHDFHIEGEEIRDAMLAAFTSKGIDASGILSPIQGLGAHLISRQELKS